MFTEQNKALSRRAIALWSTEDIAKAEEIFASTYINHQHHHPDRERPIIGLADWQQFVLEFRHAFPNLQDTIADQIAEGDKVVTRFSSQGTQTGEIMGIPATGKTIGWTGMAIDRIENGKIVETWVDWDLYGMLQQLGAVR